MKSIKKGPPALALTLPMPLSFAEQPKHFCCASALLCFFLCFPSFQSEVGGDLSVPGDGDGGRRHPEGFDDGDAFMQKMRRQMMEKKRALEKSLASKGASGGDEADVDFEPEEEEDEEEGEGGGEQGAGWRAGDANDETEKEKTRRKTIKARAKEFEALREDLKSKHRAARVMTGQERAKYDAVSYLLPTQMRCKAEPCRFGRRAGFFVLNS